MYAGKLYNLPICRQCIIHIYIYMYSQLFIFDYNFFKLWKIPFTNGKKKKHFTNLFISKKINVFKISLYIWDNHFKTLEMILYYLTSNKFAVSLPALFSGFNFFKFLENLRLNFTALNKLLLLLYFTEIPITCY